MHGDGERGFFGCLHLAHQRAGRAVRFRLVKRFRKGLFAVAAKAAQLRLERFVQQRIAGGHIVVFDFSVFVQFQLCQGLAHRQEAFVCCGGALDGFLVAWAGHLAARHAGNEHRADMLCAIFAVKCRIDVQKRFAGLLGKPYDQLVAEARPRRGEALFGAGVLRAGAVGVLKIFALNVPVIAGDAADHAVCCAGDDGGVQRVVQIAVRAHLGKPPALAQMRRNGAADGENALFAKRFGLRKRKMVGNVVVQKARHVLRVLQIALPKALGFVVGELFAQKVLALAVVVHAAVCPDDKVFAPFALQVLQRQAVALLPVFGGKHQHLVAAPVVKAEAVRHNVVHVHIARLKQLFHVQTLQRIGAHAVLLFPEAVFYKVLPGGGEQVERIAQLLHQALVFCGVFAHGAVHLLPFAESFAQLARKLYAHPCGACVHLADDTVHHFDRLRNGAAHHGACDLLHFRGGGRQCKGPLTCAVALEIVPGGTAGLVVGQPLLQMRDQFSAGLQ